MKLHVIFVVIMCMYVSALDDEKKIVEARGKGKYALLTHVAILLATKVGLYKILLGIALVMTTIKAIVLMAWGLAVAKYAPHIWPVYRHSQPENYHGGAPTPIHFAYVAATKLFILKIVYGIIFYVVATKAWHLVLWLVHYLKEKKHHEHYVQLDYEQHHGVYGYDHQPYGSYDKPAYGRIGSGDNKFYDADGSYSIAE